MEGLLSYYLYGRCRIRKEDAYGQVLAGRLSSKERSVLINKLMQRAHVNKPDIAARLCFYLTKTFQLYIL